MDSEHEQSKEEIIKFLKGLFGSAMDKQKEESVQLMTSHMAEMVRESYQTKCAEHPELKDRITPILMMESVIPPAIMQAVQMVYGNAMAQGTHATTGDIAYDTTEMAFFVGMFFGRHPDYQADSDLFEEEAKSFGFGFLPSLANDFARILHGTYMMLARDGLTVVPAEG